ncbi:unannotated protein [freshwater metagenome]|uniref:Unannotated protein n=1 Tax=freshwater metagenome TaxID=449393 RepID=A0A6J7EDM9_9ZZZZ
MGPAIATQTLPAALPSVGPGPATPVVAIAHVVPNLLSAPSAISTATSWLNTVCLAIVSSLTPSNETLILGW